MVTKSQSPQIPTPRWANDGEESEIWKVDSGSQVSSAQPATKPPSAEPVQRPASAPPGQQTPTKPMTEASRIEPVKPPSAATDIQLHPRDLGSLFAKRPLVLGEVEADYDELLSRVTTAVRPTDIIETLWVKDVVDLMWEAQRYRRFKAGLLMQTGRQALTNHLAKAKDAGQVDGVRLFTVSELVTAFIEGDSIAVAEVARILRSRGLDTDMLMAQALAERLEEVERIDRLIASADARRNRILSEIDRRRDSFARRLRSAAHDVIDVAQP